VGLAAYGCHLVYTNQHFGLHWWHQAGKLPALYEKLYFQRPRPIFELYDLQNDPYELTNLAGKPDYKAIEIALREKARYMDGAEP
jgi:arylsulfatase A-like enzyme